MLQQTFIAVIVSLELVCGNGYSYRYISVKSIGPALRIQSCYYSKDSPGDLWYTNITSLLCSLSLKKEVLMWQKLTYLFRWSSSLEVYLRKYLFKNSMRRINCRELCPSYTTSEKWQLPRPPFTHTSSNTDHIARRFQCCPIAVLKTCKLCWELGPSIGSTSPTCKHLSEHQLTSY